jgi:hypothetical protein
MRAAALLLCADTVGCKLVCSKHVCVYVHLSFSAVYCCCCVCLMLHRDTTYWILRKGGYVTSNAHYAVRPVALLLSAHCVHMCCEGR